MSTSAIRGLLRWISFLAENWIFPAPGRNHASRPEKLLHMAETYYTILGVSPNATEVELKAAWRDLMRQVHPDTLVDASPYVKKLAENRAQEINEAYSVLSDTVSRRIYDMGLGAGNGGRGPIGSPSSNSGQPSPAHRAQQRSAASRKVLSRFPALRLLTRVFIPLIAALWGIFWSWNLQSTPGKFGIRFAYASVGLGLAALIYRHGIANVLSKVGVKTPETQAIITVFLLLCAILVLSVWGFLRSPRKLGFKENWKTETSAGCRASRFSEFHGVGAKLGHKRLLPALPNDFDL